MPGFSEHFPWPSYYGHFNFFEDRMQQHTNITSCVSEGGGVYELALVRGDKLRVFVCDCYAFGVAEYIETIEKLGTLNVVIINSAWCGYSPDAKRHCRDKGVGLFKINEFMTALHRSEYWTYLTDYETQHFTEKGWL